MSEISALGNTSVAASGPLAVQADQVIKNAKSGGRESAKIEKSAGDFESILLGSWLQGAEKSFATLPDGDEDEESDPGKDQFQGMAMQSLGSSMTAAGGIGLAKMIAKQLHQTADADGRAVEAAKTHPAPA